MQKRTKSERRLNAEKAKERTNKIAKIYKWRNVKPWKIADGIDKRVGSDVGNTCVNGKYKYRPCFGSKVSRNGQHVVMERSTERKFAIDNEINAA